LQVLDSILVAILNDKFDPKDLYKLEPKWNAGKREEEKREVLTNNDFKLWILMEKSTLKCGSILSKDSFMAAFAVYTEVKNTVILGSYLHYSHFMQTLLVYEKNLRLVCGVGIFQGCV
jgi:hypothetical protein